MVRGKRDHHGEVRVKTHTFYRVEHPQTGTGPYNHYHVTCLRAAEPSWCRRMRREHELDWYNHPSPRNDLGRNPEPWEVCCFVSARQLVEWFGPYLKLALAEGFKVKRVRSARYTLGAFQALVIP